MFDFKGFISALLGKKSEDPVGNLKSATIWVQELPESDIQEGVEEIIKALGSINQNKRTSLKERIQVLMYLDEKATTLQDTLCQEYLANIDAPDAPEKLFLPTILGFWDEMAEGYQICLREFARTPSNKLWEKIPLLTARTIRYYGMQVKWKFMRYLPVEPQIWRYLHRLYLFAEREHFAQTSLRLYPHLSEETSCTSEYLQPIMLQIANPESLQPAQIDMVDRWLDSWARSINLETEFRPHRQIYAVNLADGKAAKKLRRNMLGEKYRYWGVGLMLVAITKAIDQLKNGEMPARLKLGEDCRLPACLDLIELCAQRWAGKGAKRKHERQPTVKAVHVVQGLNAIVEQLLPGAKSTGAKTVERREVDQQIIDYKLTDVTVMGPPSGEDTLSGDEEELFEPKLNQWYMENESMSGYGASFEASGRNPLKIGTLVGLKPDDQKHYAIGIVRRINKEVSSKVHVGIQTLSQTPIIVQLTPSLPSKATPVRAIYLPALPEAQAARTLLLPAKSYTRGETMTLQAQGKTYSIKLQHALEHSADYAHANFDVLAKL
jgi:hypothetical protein